MGRAEKGGMAICAAFNAAVVGMAAFVANKHGFDIVSALGATAVVSGLASTSFLGRDIERQLVSGEECPEIGAIDASTATAVIGAAVLGIKLVT